MIMKLENIDKIILAYIAIYVMYTNKSFIVYLPVFLDLVIILYIKRNI